MYLGLSVQGCPSRAVHSGLFLGVWVCSSGSVHLGLSLRVWVCPSRAVCPGLSIWVWVCPPGSVHPGLSLGAWVCPSGSVHPGLPIWVCPSGSGSIPPGLSVQDCSSGSGSVRPGLCVQGCPSGAVPPGPGWPHCPCLHSLEAAPAQPLQPHSGRPTLDSNSRCRPGLPRPGVLSVSGPCPRGRCCRAWSRGGPKAGTAPGTVQQGGGPVTACAQYLWAEAETFFPMGARGGGGVAPWGLMC